MANTISDLITALNDNTNAVAARIDRLIAPVGNAITPEQLAEFQGVSDHLKVLVLGQAPARPVSSAPSSSSKPPH